MTTTPIYSQDWQLSIAGVGQVAQGLDDLAQTVHNILMTEKGTDPMRPGFGSNISRYVDQPHGVAAANITREIIDAINRWEPRILLTSVNYVVSGVNKLDFTVGWKLLDGDATGSVNLSFGALVSPVSGPTSPTLTTFINPGIVPVLVKSRNWQLANDGPGRIVQGIQDIGQSILNIVSTMKGTDPMRPNFGSDVFDWIDRPLPVAGPSMARAIREAVNLWEPRVEILSVRYHWQDERGEQKRYPAGIKFEIGWKLRGGDITGQTDVLLGYVNDYLNGVLNPPIVTMVFYVLATENNDPILTEAGQMILVK